MSDSTNSQTRTLLDRTPRERVVKQTPCLCGCGDFPTRDTADFIPGHDAKLKSALIAAHLAGEGFVIRDESGDREVTALEVAEARDWEPFLVTAKKVADRKAKEKAEKKAK